MYRNKPAQQVLYFPMADLFRRMFKVPEMLAELEAFTARILREVPLRDRHMTEAWDGSILHDLLVGNQDGGDDGIQEVADFEPDANQPEAEEKSDESESGGESVVETREDSCEDSDEEDTSEVEHKEPDSIQEESNESEEPDEEGLGTAEEHTLYLSLTADGTETHKNLSVTPVTSKILNLRGRLRSLLSNIRLHAVLPPKVKDYNGLLRPVAEEFYNHRPNGGKPIRLLHPTKGTPVHLYVVLAWMVNDIRGQMYVTGGHSPPCYEGSCAMCKV
jgi:hypothetical protein